MDIDAGDAAPRGTKRKADDSGSSVEDVPKRIKALEQDVINKIAAGEIVVAPVHALKELLENAVDAGSTSIEILVKDGGLKLLQITDNGHGINRDDLPILCERFTTSKLKDFDDLMSIGTYGFRGEALASISHIAHLQITTKTKDSSAAYRAHYSDGRLVPAKPGQSADPKPCAGRPGTQITVEDLFYNVPTRRRAFRSPAEEYNKILDLVGRYAVHCAGVAFSCKKHSDSSMGISVQAAASTVDRIRQIHGSAVANELIQVEASNGRWGFTCDGWISNANYHVKKLVLLLFINHRAVESSAIKKAVEQTFSTFLPKVGHPFVYLSLSIDPQRVDVNVHPTKREVNFLNEEEIIEVICEEIRTRLGKVDTSRTFMTQTLLPGVPIPTISIESLNAPQKSGSGGVNGVSPLASTGSTFQTPQVRTQIKPYENNLVRTDSKVRKITSMFSSANHQTPPSAQRPKSDQPSNESDEMDIVPSRPEQQQQQQQSKGNATEYSYVEKEHKPCQLSSIKQLRAEVGEAMHNDLTDVFTTHTFVGIVDETRRIAAIQGGVKLFLVDYAMVCNEYFYQLGLTDFGNFGSIVLNPPLSLRELVRIGALQEADAVAERRAGRRNEAAADEDDEIDWSFVIDSVVKTLVSNREMLREYFSLDISDDEQLKSIPLLIKGYAPSMLKLPQFLLRLGPHVDWKQEESCFRSFLTELASFYVPEAFPAAAATSSSSTTRKSGQGPAGGAGGEMVEDENSAVDQVMRDRRDHVARALEYVLFPAFKARLISTQGMLRGVVEVANLKGLYRVFERC